jgi:serine/threonine-protein kinase RsbW
VELFLDKVFRENNLPPERFNRVLLCISEAVINSIEHGNRNDTGKNVFIETECYNGNISIKISDEGNGFDHRKINDPTMEPNIKAETGRGIHIIKSLADEFNFVDRGKSVCFKVSVSE